MISRLINNNENLPRTDYPRPQWTRESWYSLNGEWDFAFDFGKSGEDRGMVTAGTYTHRITVPFCPESTLSGIGYTDFIPAVWYRRTVHLDEIPEGRVLIHFGAVDYHCKVWVNGTLVGTHRGGYTAFEFDITAALTAGDNTITVYSEDDNRGGRQPRGKQCEKYQSYACSYTRTTGIWQTVWLEFVPDVYLKSSRLTPHAADGTLDVNVFASEYLRGYTLKLTAFYNGKAVGETQVSFVGNYASAVLSVRDIHLWEVGAPELYDLRLELADPSGKTADTVESYFAMRDVSFDNTSLIINGKRVFMRMILDQGFNPEGIYTAPSDEYLENDIRLAMDLGFNGARLHQRVFEDRTLYHADRLGYIVWAEFPGGVSLEHADAIETIMPQWKEIIHSHYNHPAVIGWCPFNETYHRLVMDTEVIRTIYSFTKEMDPLRPVIDASGGVHYDTDMFDVHDYEQDPEKLRGYLAPMLDNPNYFHSPIPPLQRPCTRTDRNLPRPGLLDQRMRRNLLESDGCFGPKGLGYGDTPKAEKDFGNRYAGLMHVMLSHPRVCGFCYTQLTDIEQEQNGLYFYDRTRKFDDSIYKRMRNANLETAAIEQE